MYSQAIRNHNGLTLKKTIQLSTSYANCIILWSPVSGLIQAKFVYKTLTQSDL